MSRVFQQSLQFVFSAVLARLLVPNDFGLIALISVFTGFASVFVDLGFTAAIVQRSKVDERHLSTAFWLNVMAGTGLMVVVMGMAPAIAAFYDQPQLVPLTLALAPSFLLGSLVGLQSAMLTRQMNFKRLTMIENSALVGANALAIGLAVSGFGVWSLVALALASAAIRAVLLWSASSWRPRAFLDRESVRDLWGFSSRLTAFNAVNYWARNADNLLVGRFIGTDSLAFYNRAYNLMLLPLDLVSSVPARVMLPVLSRLQDEPELVKRVYLRSIGLIALVTFPAMVGLFVVCEPFILTVYGSKWAPVIPLLQIFCVTGLVQSLHRTTGWIFYSQGRTDRLFTWGLFSTATAICSFFVGLPWGVRGIAVAYTCWSILITYPLLRVTGGLIGLSIREILRAVAGVGLASAVMGVVVWIVEVGARDALGSGLQLAVGVVTGIVSYVFALHVISPKAYGDFRRLVHEYSTRRAGASGDASEGPSEE